MNRCVLTLLLYLLTVPATAGDLPFMRLFSPDPQTTKYSQSSNILVAGRVAPFIESGVRIDLYEVRDNGRLFRLVGTEINMDSRGVFSSSLLPPAKGWPIGNIRVVATLCDLAQVKQSTTIEVAKRKDIPEEGIETKQLEHSDIIVDTEQSNGPYQVIGGHTFLIRGRFVQEGARGSPRAPA